MSKTAFQEGYESAPLFPNSDPRVPNNREQISREMHILAASHKLPVEKARHFDLLSQALDYEDWLHEHGAYPTDRLLPLKQASTEVADFVFRDNSPIALCHRAFLLTNSGIECDKKALLTNGGYRYADYATDFGTYAVTRNLCPDDIFFALEEYLEREPNPKEIRHHWAMIGLAGWTGYLWCLKEEARLNAPSPMKTRCQLYAIAFLQEALAFYSQE